MDTVSLFLVFLAIVLVGAALYLGAGMVKGRSIGSGLEQPVPGLPAVLLPEEAKPADVDSVRFALGLRGYRMDQVDQVLDELKEQLQAKELEIERLKALVQPRLEDGESDRAPR
ncbi:DivIVA domain-containing protein [Arthrobacter sp. FW305-123]|nr:DivIVA domain-containing protein [Arthrobacter sp. FW305-123]